MTHAWNHPFRIHRAADYRGRTLAQPPGIIREMIGRSLPLEGAPLAIPGPYKITSEARTQAGLVVLDRDYMTVPVADIKHIHPTLTMVGGSVVFTAAQ